MYVTHARVGTSQIDATSNMKLVSAIDIIQDCSGFWLESEPILQKHLEENSIAVYLASRQVDIVRMPHYGERLTVCTGIFEINDLYGYRNTAVFDEEGKQCILTWGIAPFVNKFTGKLVKVSKDVVEKITIDQKIDMAYLGRKIVLPDGRLERLTPVMVRRNDIDANKHVNNVRYIEAALEIMPVGFQIKRLRVEYKMPAKYGDTLYPAVVVSSGELYLIFFDEQDRQYAVMEFTQG